jgi:hypothetical protein
LVMVFYFLQNNKPINPLDFSGKAMFTIFTKIWWLEGLSTNTKK